MLCAYTLPGILVLLRELRTSASPYVHLTRFPAGLALPKLSLNSKRGPRCRLIISACDFSVLCVCLLGHSSSLAKRKGPKNHHILSILLADMFFKIFQGPNCIGSWNQAAEPNCQPPWAPHHLWQLPRLRHGHSETQ